MADSLDTDLGTFESEDLLEFINSSIGPLFYNRGVLDAQAMLTQRVEYLVEAMSELEKSTPFDR